MTVRVEVPALLRDLSALPANSNPQNLLAIGDVVYFTATDAEHGTELWRTDGTPGGTAIVAEWQQVDTLNPYYAGANTDYEVLTAFAHQAALAIQKARLLDTEQTRSQQLEAVRTLTSEINFYTRLMKMRDRVTSQPMFTLLSVELACAACKAEGKATDCVHMLHLVPRWQSADRHVKLKTIMQVRGTLLCISRLELRFNPKILQV